MNIFWFVFLCLVNQELVVQSQLYFYFHQNFALIIPACVDFLACTRIPPPARRRSTTAITSLPGMSLSMHSLPACYSTVQVNILSLFYFKAFIRLNLHYGVILYTYVIIICTQHLILYETL